MAKNAQNDPILIGQTLKTPYFLITNVTGPIHEWSWAPQGTEILSELGFQGVQL